MCQNHDLYMYVYIFYICRVCLLKSEYTYTYNIFLEMYKHNKNIVRVHQDIDINKSI